MTLDCTCNRLIEAEAKAAKWDAIVRCGECQWHLEPRFPHKTHGCMYPWEKGHTRKWLRTNVLQVTPDHFCAWGERREI